MKKLHKDRLLRLAAFLREKVPDEHFNLEVFVSDGEDVDALKQLPKIAAGKQRGCGSVACAIGWCPAVFPEHWQWSRRFLHDVGLKGGRWLSSGFDFAEDFFQLSERECWYLFSARTEHRSRTAVARRIKAFVRRGGLPKSWSKT